jgi:AbrB family looped-hinge helix DNA binding protein
MVVLATGNVGRNFRVTLPKEVREYLDLEEGAELVFFTIGSKKGRVCFRKTRP